MVIGVYSPRKMPSEKKEALEQILITSAKNSKAYFSAHP